MHRTSIEFTDHCCERGQEFCRNKETQSTCGEGTRLWTEPRVCVCVCDWGTILGPQAHATAFPPIRV